MPLIFITSGSLWTVPNDCFLIDWVDCIGAGGGARNNASTTSVRPGAGGGAWSRSVGLRVTPGVGVPYAVGVGGSPDVDGGDTWFNATSAADAVAKGPATSCLAKGGWSTNPHLGAWTLGGQASAGIGVQRYSGGNGYIDTSVSQQGGGGAAGPNGNGNPPGSVNPRAGGSGDAGYGGGGGAGVNGGTGQNGGAGTEYGSYGSGGGGGSSQQIGGNRGGYGGSYGGGGGAGVNGGGDSYGAGGLIVISYTPGKGGPSGFNMPMMGL